MAALGKRTCNSHLNFAIADNVGPSVRAADYVEGTIGVAHRPILHDRLTILARYNHFQDLRPVGEVTAGGETGNRSKLSAIRCAQGTQAGSGADQVLERGMG